MSRLRRRPGPSQWVIALMTMWAGGIALIAAGPVSPPTPAKRSAAATQAPSAAPPAAQAADYVGQDTCVTCHDDKNYKGTAHALVSNPRSPVSTHGCESCHGPGKAHAESGDKTQIVNLKTLSPQRASEACATCHDRSKHALWSGSQHDQRSVSCLTCHSVHDPVGPKQLKAKTEPELCATCHRNIVNKLNRFNHMPVREGKMQCSSCHNPHGSTNVKLLKNGTTVDEACATCHAEKRGPYLWEHAPVANACITCHDPHGSNNERMLVAKVPFLCQRCHVTSRHPPTVYDGYVLANSTNGNKLSNRGCVVCHAQIHGSNHPSGKAYLR